MENDISMERAVLFPRMRLVNKLLLVEGPTRSGKFLLGNIICGLQGVEHYQAHGILETIPALFSSGLIERDTAKAILQCQIDNYAFDYAVGRNVNFRKDDKSSILNSVHSQEYIERTRKTDHTKTIELLQDGKTYSPFIVHETFPNIRLYFDTYSELRVIRLERDLIDLTYSWFRRGWGSRWGVDPLVFDIVLQGPTAPIPMFAKGWMQEYESSNEMDRIIRSIVYTDMKSIETYQSLTSTQRENVHRVIYDDILIRPIEVIHRLGEFIEKSVSPEIDEIMAIEGLPKDLPKKDREEKITFIKGHASPGCFDLLVRHNEDRLWD